LLCSPNNFSSTIDPLSTNAFASRSPQSSLSSGCDVEEDANLTGIGVLSECMMGRIGVGQMEGLVMHYLTWKARGLPTVHPQCLTEGDGRKTKKVDNSALPVYRRISANTFGRHVGAAINRRPSVREVNWVVQSYALVCNCQQPSIFVKRCCK